MRLSHSLLIVKDVLHCDRCSLLYASEEGEQEILSVPLSTSGEVAVLKARLAGILRALDDDQQRPAVGNAAEIALPLMGLDQVRGILVAERRPSAFTTVEMRLFSVIAAQLGAYLTMLQLHRKARDLDRFKQEMSAVIVHDLKNPMAAIVATMDYLAMDLREAPDDVQSALMDIRAASNRMLRLIANLMDLARLESNRLPLSPVAIRVASVFAALAGQRSAQATSKRVKILVRDVPTDLRIEADEDLFARVIENLLDNAMRYTPPEGRIEITARLAGVRVEIAVGNTGPPIPRSALAGIFEKYGQASGGGRMNMGLGLYFARVAMEAQDGRIWVAETASLPTCFFLELPMAEEARAPI
jgi:signal transduction histidine kinase